MKKTFYQDAEMKINQDGTIRLHKENTQRFFGKKSSSVDDMVAAMHAEEKKDAANHVAAKNDPVLRPYIR